MPVYPDILSTVGRTPLVKLNRIAQGVEATIALKAEFFNPLGSVKDRIGGLGSAGYLCLVPQAAAPADLVETVQHAASYN